MKQQYGLSIMIVLAFTLGCAHIVEYNTRSYEPIEISQFANRTFESPWPNQENFGYREWPKGEQTFFDIPFVFDDESVISLAPGESITIEFGNNIEANAVSLITSANFVYNNSLRYEVEIMTNANLPNGKQHNLFTPEWVQGIGDDLKTFGNYEIFVDGHAAMGQFTHNQLVFSNSAVPVNGIRIHNTSTGNMQHLTIAAITMIDNPGLEMGEV